MRLVQRYLPLILPLIRSRLSVAKVWLQKSITAFLIASNFKQQYGLVVAAKVDEEATFHCSDMTIEVEIKMKDGSAVHKQRFLSFGEDAFEEVQIKIVN